LSVRAWTEPSVRGPGACAAGAHPHCPGRVVAARAAKPRVRGPSAGHRRRFAPGMAPACRLSGSAHRTGARPAPDRPSPSHVARVTWLESRGSNYQSAPLHSPHSWPASGEEPNPAAGAAGPVPSQGPPGALPPPGSGGARVLPAITPSRACRHEQQATARPSARTRVRPRPAHASTRGERAAPAASSSRATTPCRKHAHTIIT
jgi:hypothetical protein